MIRPRRSRSRSSLAPRSAALAVVGATLFALGCGADPGPLAVRSGESTSEPTPVPESSAVATTDPTADPAARPTASATDATPAATPVATTSTPAGTASANHDATWYSPVAADFRAVYERDPANAQKQSWESYWSWVQTFYEGNVLAEGWKAQASRLVDKVRDAEARAALRTALNDFGRRIAGEWAKNGDTRKINTNDLLELGPRLQLAKERDDGTGAALRAELDALHKHLDSRFR